jgi:DNA-binding GntR family transcriptional regulator
MPELPRSRDGQDVALAYQGFREAILQGDFRPGEIMTQQQIVERLGISRTPLREAIRILQHEGLLSAEPHRRLQVAEFSVEDVESVYAMRVLLECAAVRVTVPGLLPRDIAEMKGLMAQMDHFGQPEAVREWEIPHRAFHAVLVSRAGDRMTTTIRQLSDHAERYRRVYLATATSTYETSAKEHADMLVSAGAGDAGLTASLLAHHYLRTAGHVISLIDPHYVSAELNLAVRLVGDRSLD